MSQRRIVISINSSWNIYNFRRGLIRGLQAAGHEVIALAPDDGFMGKLADLGCETVVIDMDRSGLAPHRDLLLLARYRKALRTARADIFLGYTIKPNIYGSLAAQSLGIKVINNVSGLGTAFISGGWLTRLVSSLYRLAFARSSTIFFQNEEDRALLLGKGLLAPAKARLLPGSGVDLAHFAPAAPRAEGDAPIFLLVARLLRDKGVVEFVEAARTVRARHPGTRFQLLGDVDPGNRTAIARETLGDWIATGLVEHLGRTEDVRPALAAADVVVLPSYREGLPRVLLEAAAMGKPLIATDVPGCRQVVREGENGFLCAVRNAGSLAAAISRMIDVGPQERARLGRAARLLVEREYDERLVVAAYLEVIKDALAPPR